MPPQTSDTSGTTVSVLTVDIPKDSYFLEYSEEELRDRFRTDFFYGSKVRTEMTKISSLKSDINRTCIMCNNELIFYSSSEIDAVSHQLMDLLVSNDSSLRLFLTCLEKYIIEGANYGTISRKSRVKITVKRISMYRNSFEHLIMAGKNGDGVKSFLKTIGNINEHYLGHRILNRNDYILLQIQILMDVRRMLEDIRNNIEQWLDE